MKILGLPGIKPATADWLNSLIETIAWQQAEIYIHHYKTWNNPGTRFDIQQEVNIAARVTPGIVIAKSIGTRVALHGYQNDNFHPAVWILIGLPIYSYTNQEISVLNEMLNKMPVLIIQQTADPAGTFIDVKSLVSTGTYSKLVDVPGNDHWYGDTVLLAETVHSWENTLSVL